jgi:hypothetical protein
MNIGETGSDWFHWFSVNRSVNLIFYKNEIKILKTTRGDFKIFGENRIQKLKSIDLQNSEKRKPKEKPRK